MVCLPAIATTACFVALILLDLYNRDWRRIPGHSLFGVFAVLLILFICQKGSETIAWILLGSPFVLVFLSYLFSLWFESKSVDPSPSECPCCSFNPCHCRKPCWRPRPRPNPRPPCPTPEPEPKPKPDNCIQSSLA
jgi:hypothetical protein